MHGPESDGVEPHLEHRRARGLRDLQLDRDVARHDLVALAAEEERIDVDVDRLSADVPGP